MRRLYFKFFIVLLLVSILGFSNSTFAYSEKEPMVLKVAIPTPPTNILAVTVKRFGLLHSLNLVARFSTLQPRVSATFRLDPYPSSRVRFRS